jgi:hypothetical protein
MLRASQIELCDRFHEAKRHPILRDNFYADIEKNTLGFIELVQVICPNHQEKLMPLKELFGDEKVNRLVTLFFDNATLALQEAAQGEFQRFNQFIRYNFANSNLFDYFANELSKLDQTTADSETAWEKQHGCYIFDTTLRKSIVSCIKNNNLTELEPFFNGENTHANDFDQPLPTVFRPNWLSEKNKIGLIRIFATNLDLFDKALGSIFQFKGLHHRMRGHRREETKKLLYDTCEKLLKNKLCDRSILATTHTADKARTYLENATDLNNFFGSELYATMRALTETATLFPLTPIVKLKTTPLFFRALRKNYVEICKNTLVANRAFQQSESLGFFDKEYKKPLPMLPYEVLEEIIINTSDLDVHDRESAQIIIRNNWTKKA